MNKTWLMYGIAFALGVIAANKVRALPLGNKLPSI